MDKNSNSIKKSIFLKIAITGKMGSGKSTLAKIISEIIEGHITSFSEQIRKVVRVTDLPITREILQQTGDFFRKFNNVIWVDMLLKEIKQVQKPVIIDGIRYPFEAEKLVKNGFKIIKIESLEKLRRTRIAKRDKIRISDELWKSWISHPTEQFLDQIQHDYKIENNQSIEKLKTDVKSILNRLNTKA